MLSPPGTTKKELEERPLPDWCVEAYIVSYYVYPNTLRWERIEADGHLPEGKSYAEILQCLMIPLKGKRIRIQTITKLKV